ncbi:MAG: hypothetical protein AAGE94_03055 [Acidobacteriota bacterium]
MKTRLKIELFLIGGLALAVLLVWFWGERQLVTQTEKLTADYEAQLEAQRLALATDRERRADHEAVAVFRAFAAGVQSAILAGRADAVDSAVGELLEVPGVVAVHVLRADGSVVATSDRKLATTGSLDERDAWVLEISGLVSKRGRIDGTREVASAIRGAAGGRELIYLVYEPGAEAPAPITPVAPQTSPEPTPEAPPGEEAEEAAAEGSLESA